MIPRDLWINKTSFHIQKLFASSSEREREREKEKTDKEQRKQVWSTNVQNTVNKQGFNEKTTKLQINFTSHSNGTWKGI